MSAWGRLAFEGNHRQVKTATNQKRVDSPTQMQTEQEQERQKKYRDAVAKGDLAKVRAALEAGWVGVNDIHVEFDPRADRSDYYFPQRYPPRRNTALTLAINAGHVEVVEALLSQSNIDVNAMPEGFSPLNVACYYGHSEKIVRLLVARKDVDVNLRTKYGGAALHSLEYRPEIVKLLLKRADIDVNATDNSKNTPMHCFYDPPSLRVLLRRRDIDVNRESSNSEYPVQRMASMCNYFGSNCHTLNLRVLFVHFKMVMAPDVPNCSRRGYRGRRGVWLKRRWERNFI